MRPLALVLQMDFLERRMRRLEAQLDLVLQELRELRRGMRELGQVAMDVSADPVVDVSPDEDISSPDSIVESCDTVGPKPCDSGA